MRQRNYGRKATKLKYVGWLRAFGKRCKRTVLGVVSYHSQNNIDIRVTRRREGRREVVGMKSFEIDLFVIDLTPGQLQRDISVYQCKTKATKPQVKVMVYNLRHRIIHRKYINVKIVSNNKIRIFSRIYIKIIHESLEFTHVQMTTKKKKARKNKSGCNSPKGIPKCPPTVIEKHTNNTQFIKWQAKV